MSFLHTLHRQRRSVSLLAPIDLLVTLLMQPTRSGRDGVAHDLDAARQRHRR